MIGLLPEPAFMVVFAGCFIGAVIYLLCLLKLGGSLRDLKRRGRGLDAPDFTFSTPNVVALVWLVAGRYGKLGDEAVTRWSTLARTLLFLLFPVFLLIFANVLWDIVSKSKA